MLRWFTCVRDKYDCSVSLKRGWIMAFFGVRCIGIRFGESGLHFGGGLAEASTGRI